MSLYDDDYIEMAFQTWYGANKCSIRSLIPLLPEVEGKLPSAMSVQRWMTERGWHERADGMDAKAIQIVEDKLITAKAKMLEEQAEAGRELRLKGMEYIKEKGVDSSASAIRAVEVGSELERTARGTVDLLRKITNMDDDTLANRIKEFAKKHATDGEVIDAGTEAPDN